MCEPLLTPAGENLEHNTLVAAQPNLNADGAFRLPPSFGLVDCGARIERVLRGGLARLKNWTEVQFASWPLWCSVIYRCAFKLSVEMCQNFVPVGTTRKKKITLSLMFFHQNKFDKYLNCLEMRPWQVPMKCNGTFFFVLEFNVGKKTPFVVTSNE